MKYTNTSFGEDVYKEVLSHGADKSVNQHVHFGK